VPHKLAEALQVARRFRHEQRYRAEIENLINQLRVLGLAQSDEALTRLRMKALDLLARVSEKKIHVARVETEARVRKDHDCTGSELSVVHVLIGAN
jgi:hypothetical protein